MCISISRRPWFGAEEIETCLNRLLKGKGPYNVASLSRVISLKTISLGQSYGGPLGQVVLWDRWSAGTGFSVY